MFSKKITESLNQELQKDQDFTFPQPVMKTKAIIDLVINGDTNFSLGFLFNRSEVNKANQKASIFLEHFKYDSLRA